MSGGCFAIPGGDNVMVWVGLFGLVWFGLVWFVLFWFGLVCLVWFGLVWFGFSDAWVVSGGVWVAVVLQLKVETM